MDRHDRMIRAFLAGDLDPQDAPGFDEHLLECEQCWRALREDRDGRAAAGLLRQPAPAGLADRVRFAVEVAAAGGTYQKPQARRAWLRRGPLAAAGVAGAGLAIAAALLVQGGRPAEPAAVAAVARYAQSASLPAARPAPPAAAPVEVGRPATLTAAGQKIVVSTWRLGGVEAVVAVSARPFPMPPGAHVGSGTGMAWSARQGTLSLYCVNGRTSELVAGPAPVAQLAALASHLPA